LDEAEATYKDAVAKNPKNIQAHVSLLSFYVKQKRLDAAEQEARAIKDLGGKPARPLLARFYIMTNRAPEAEKEFKSLIAQGDPDNSITRELAVLYLNEGRYDEGRQLVDKILKDTPHNAVALMLRGRLELADQKVEPAVEDLQNAIKSDPDLAQAYLYLSEGLQRLGKTQEAEAALSDALRRDPKNRPARMALAQQELRLGENDQAVSDLEKVMSSSQNDMSAQLLMAQAMANKQEYADADKRMAELLAQAQQPNARALIYRTWAQMKLKEKKPQDARKYASSALDLEPRNLANFAALAFAYIQANQGPAGLQDLKRRVEKYPDWAEGYEWLGVMAIKVNDLNAANQWFEKALQLDPKNVRYQRSLAEMYGVEGKMDQAKAAYEAIIAQHPDDAPSLFRAAQLNEQSGNWPRAEALYKHCIELNPKDAASKNNLAYGYLTHNGNVDVALKLAQEAKEQMPSDPTIDDTVAWAYIQKGSYTAAVEFLKQALEKSPNQPTFNYHLGYAYMKSGNSSEAKKAFESALKTPAFVSTKDGADAKQYLATLH
jgi:tetratricopeptide (TPR) repeat protein